MLAEDIDNDGPPGFVDINISGGHDDDGVGAAGRHGDDFKGHNNGPTAGHMSNNGGTMGRPHPHQGMNEDDFSLLDVELTQHDNNNYITHPKMSPTYSSESMDEKKESPIPNPMKMAPASTVSAAKMNQMTQVERSKQSPPLKVDTTIAATGNTAAATATTAAVASHPLMAPDNENYHTNFNDNENTMNQSDDYHHDDDDNEDIADTTTYSPRSLTDQDLNVIQQLDEDYEKTLIEREIGWNARYISVRQNAGLSIWFMILFLTTGTIFFDYNTDWTLGESLLFSIYTITTVGYGRHEFPREDGILLFISVYIFLGIATLTIMAAQLYQWVVLELTWARYEHDKQLFTKQHERNIQATNDVEDVNAGSRSHGPMMDLSDSGEVKMNKTCAASTLDYAVVIINKVQNFVKEYPYGQIIVVMVPFFSLICLGALVVGSIEEWSFMESMYFSIVSLTTVGYGDYYPDKPATRWFCIIWLPFSVFFVSLYLGSVAGFYIEMSNRNIRRIERRLRKRMQLFKSWQEREKAAARLRGLSGGFDANIRSEDEASHIPSHIQQNPSNRGSKKKGFDRVSSKSPDPSLSPRKELKGSKLPKTKNRRGIILSNSGVAGSDPTTYQSVQTMKTMKDVIVAVKMNMSSSRRSRNQDPSDMLETGEGKHNEALNVHSTTFYNTSRGIAKKPTFALRVLVQERLAYIISHEVAGYQSSVSIKNNTLSVTIESLKQTCEKWYIPRRATKNFRSVAFETLYFVGERQLIVKGAEAVFELRPAEVQGLFGPVLAALGDAGTMEAWLNRTQHLAETELKCSDSDKNFKLNLVDDRRLNQVTQNMTSDPKHKRTVIGNAFSD